MAHIIRDILQASSMMLVAVPVALVLRFILKRAPKAFCYALWCLVFLRLLCPFTVETARGLLPSRQAVEQRIGPVLEKPVPVAQIAAEQAPRLTLPPVSVPAGTFKPAQVPTGMAAAPSAGGWTVADLLPWVWLAGVAVLLCGALRPWLRLRRILRTAIRAEDGVWESDRIKTPFVLGLLCPRIYLPLGLCGGERQYILAHERTHIRRGDHLVKLAAFAAIVIHWFNPLVWLAYWMLCRDMELSCDESVLCRSHEDIRVPYAGLLLRMAARQSGWFTVLAFGEGSVRQRVKNSLRYKKAALGVLCLATLAVCAAGVLLMTRQKEEEPASLASSVLYGAEDTYVRLDERYAVSMLPDSFSVAGRVKDVEEEAPSRAHRATYLRSEFRIRGGEGLMGGTVYADANQPMLYVYDENRRTYLPFMGRLGNGDVYGMGEPAIEWGGSLYWLDEKRQRFAQVPQGYQEEGTLETSATQSRPVPAGNGMGYGIDEAYWGGAVYVSDGRQSLLLQDEFQGGYILFTQAEEKLRTEEQLLAMVEQSILQNKPNMLAQVTPGTSAGLNWDSPSSPEDIYYWDGHRVQQVELVEREAQGYGPMQHVQVELKVKMDAATTGMVSNQNNTTSVYCIVQMRCSRSGWIVTGITTLSKEPRWGPGSPTV